MRRCNEACNFVSDNAFSLKLTNKYKLHKIVSVCRDKKRDKFNQSSQFAVRIISKVVEASKRKKAFYLIVVDAAAEESQYDHVVDVLGVDMGIENVATDSDNQIFEGSKVEQIRKLYA